MKHLIYYYIAAALIAASALTSCIKDNPTPGEEPAQDNTITGTWHLASWTGLTSADIYVSFNENGSFDLYQRLYSPIYEHLTGSWSLDGDILSGTYDDGIPWRTDYKVRINASGDMLTLVATDNAEDKATYNKAEIPEEILSGDLSLKSSERPGSQGLRFL